MVFKGSFLKKILLFALLIFLKSLYTAAEILPFAQHPVTKKYYFLLGKAMHREEWSGFGRKEDSTFDNGNIFNSTIRKFRKETSYPEKEHRELRLQIKTSPLIKHPKDQYFILFPKIKYQLIEYFKSNDQKSEISWIPVDLFLQQIGKIFAETGIMPNYILYDGKEYWLEERFKECLVSLFLNYKSEEKEFYFKKANPDTIINRILAAQLLLNLRRPHS